MRIQDFVRGGGETSEILPTSHSRVASTRKIWASKLRTGGRDRPSENSLDQHLIIVNELISIICTIMGIACWSITRIENVH